MTKIATNSKEQHAIVCLREWIPQPLPSGWSSLQDDIVRMNEFGKPGVFARLLRNPEYRIQFEVASETCACRASLSRTTGAILTDSDIEEVRQVFFGEGDVTVRRVLPGLVIFEMPP